MQVKGTLIAIGGNEDKGTRKKKLHTVYTPSPFLTHGILWRILSLTQEQCPQIEVVTTASSIPEEVGKMYSRAFSKLGCPQVGIMHLRTAEEADQPEFIQRIQQCGCVLFSGGDQFRLTSVLKDTRFFEIVKSRYIHESFIVAGTSAGAMAMSDVMIYPGTGNDAHLQREVATYPGLSLIHDVIIDTHFLARGRFRRLAQAVADRITYLGIGLEEDTGLIIREGKILEAIGTGLVTIIDARKMPKLININFCNLEQIYLENLTVHLLAQGNLYTLPEV